MCDLLVVLVILSIFAESIEGIFQDESDGHVLFLQVDKVLLFKLPVIQPFLHFTYKVQNAFGFKFIEFSHLKVFFLHFAHCGMQEGDHNCVFFLCGLFEILEYDTTNNSELLLQVFLYFCKRMWFVVDIVC